MSNWVERHRPSPALVISMLALTLSLTGGAYALVQTAKLKRDEVRSKHVKDDTLTGADIASDSLTGAEVNEQSLNLPPQVPTPLSGPAGGDLTGTYPNPQLGAGAVGTPELANASVTATKIGDDQVIAEDIAPNAVGGLDASDVNAEQDTILDDSVGSADIANGSVGAAEIATGGVGTSEIQDDSVSASDLGSITTRTADTLVPGGVAEDGAYFTANLLVQCEPGEIAIGGGAEWFEGGSNQELFLSESIRSGNGWFVSGGNDSGADTVLHAQVYCLQP